MLSQMAPSPDEATLARLMDSMRISPACNLALEDAFLTEAELANLFGAAVEDVAMLLQSLSATPRVFNSLLESFVTHLVLAVRKPYLAFIGEQTTKLEKLKETHIALKNSHSTLEEKHISLTETHNTLEGKHISLTETHNALEGKYISSIETHNTLKGTHNTELRQQTETHYRELLAVNGRHQAKISKLNKGHQAVVSKLNSEHQAVVSKLNSEHQATVMELNNKHQGIISKLNSEHQAAISLQHKTSSQEISKMRTKLEDLTSHKHMLLMERKMQDENSDSVPASVNRIETWLKVLEKNPRRQDLDHPVLPEDYMIADSSIRDLAARDYSRESLMYLPFRDCLEAYLSIDRSEPHPGVRLWDTHASKHLDGRSPDMTITVANTSNADPFSIIAIWELKVGILDHEAHGQVYDYLKIISKKQPDRSHFIGVLSNLKENILITLTRENSGSKFQCSTYKVMTLEHAISHIRYLALQNAEYLPPIPAFSIDLGVIRSRLGNPAYSLVAAFMLPKNLRSNRFKRGRWVSSYATEGDGKRTMVVKRTVPARGGIPARHVKSEIEILQLIQQLGGHDNLPQILYHTDDEQEFAIEPHGYPIKPGEIFLSWRRALADVLSALRWLHGHNIIHRDVRWDNVVWAHERAILIDFGAAVHHPEPTECLYGGGYICCPPAVIPNFNDLYTPRPADDCYAFVLLVNMLCWPERWKNLRSNDISRERSEAAQKLLLFWKDAYDSPLWGPYVAAAENANHDFLEGLLDHCVYYGAPEAE